MPATEAQKRANRKYYANHPETHRSNNVASAICHKKRYHSDPEYRQKKLEYGKQYRLKKKQEKLEQQHDCQCDCSE